MVLTKKTQGNTTQNQWNEQIDKTKNVENNKTTNENKSSITVDKTKNVRKEIEVPQASTHQEDLSTVTHATMRSSQKKEYPEQTKVFECVKERIFKKYKFCKYDDPRLEYLPKKGSICKIIIQQCGCSNKVDNDEWWSVAKCWIARKIIVLKKWCSNAAEKIILE